MTLTVTFGGPKMDDRVSQDLIDLKYHMNHAMAFIEDPDPTYTTELLHSAVFGLLERVESLERQNKNLLERLKHVEEHQHEPDWRLVQYGKSGQGRTRLVTPHRQDPPLENPDPPTPYVLPQNSRPNPRPIFKGKNGPFGNHPRVDNGWGRGFAFPNDPGEEDG